MFDSQRNWILAFDCSSPTTCLALGQRNSSTGTSNLVDVEIVSEQANQVSTLLTSKVETLLRRNETGFEQLSTVACGRGPGTFTGSRVGGATASGIAYALQIPLIPVSTLSSLAASADKDGSVLALLDARRSQVYGGLFSVEKHAVRAIGTEKCIALADLLDDLRKDGQDLGRLFYRGPGVAAYCEQLPSELEDEQQNSDGITPEGLWKASMAAYEKQVQPGQFQVQYLRASYAEMGIHKPKRAFKKSPFV